jgi:hypothetical protein
VSSKIERRAHGPRNPNGGISSDWHRGDARSVGHFLEEKSQFARIPSQFHYKMSYTGASPRPSPGTAEGVRDTKLKFRLSFSTFLNFFSILLIILVPHSSWGNPNQCRHLGFEGHMALLSDEVAVPAGTDTI